MLHIKSIAVLFYVFNVFLDEMTDVVDIFDAVHETISSGPAIDSMRRQCCLVDFNGSLYISGGDILTDSNVITGADTILGNKYTLYDENTTTVDADDDDDGNNWECTLFSMSCEQDDMFNGQFYRYSKQSYGYWMWFSVKGIGIFYKPNDQCWIGSVADSVWSFSLSRLLQSGEWFVIYKDYSLDVLTIEITCVESVSVNDESGSGNYSLGLNQISFYVLLIAVCIILVFLCVILWFVVQKRKQIARKKEYHTSNKGYISSRLEDEKERIAASKKFNISSIMLFKSPKSAEFVKEVRHVVKNDSVDNSKSESDSEIYASDVLFDEIDEDRDQLRMQNRKEKITTEQLFPDVQKDVDEEEVDIDVETRM